MLRRFESCPLHQPNAMALGFAFPSPWSCGECGEGVNAPDCGSGMHGFESHHSPQMLGNSQVVRQRFLVPRSKVRILLPQPFTAQRGRALRRRRGRVLCGGIAQLGEHLPCKQGVVGSNPATSTMMFLDSSAVEHPAVNRRVAGSNPARGASSAPWSSG